jgi:ABC-type Mn2+/Zn2+ transport system ATPase subunit
MSTESLPPSSDGHAASAVEPATGLAVHGLYAGYRSVVALEDVTFALPRGSLAALVGPNGAGKSTLIQALLGLVTPWSGSIQVLGEDKSRRPFAFGYVPQSSDLDLDFPVTVRDVVAMGRYPRLGPGRRMRAADWAVVDHSLVQVGMAALAERRIGELSGGQRQRVLLARALAQEAPVLLLDEPVSGVDTLSQQAVLTILKRLAREGSTILVATHDLALVAEYFDHVVCLNRRLIAAGPTETVLTEATLNATFNSRMVLVRVEGKLYAVDTGTHG